MSSSNTIPPSSASEMDKDLRSLIPRKGFRTLSLAQRKAALSRLKSKSQAANQAQSNSPSLKKSDTIKVSLSWHTRLMMWLKGLKNLPARLHIRLAQKFLKKRNMPDKILQHPDKRLARIAEPIDFNKTTREDRDKLAARMIRSLVATGYGDRLGIAAPQIGINKRVIIVKGMVMFNPEWQPSKAPKNLITEGCYSVSGKLYKVERAPYGWAKWVDIDGVEKSQKFIGTDAVVFQHEVDHLDGKCCVDVGKEIPKPGLEKL